MFRLENSRILAEFADNGALVRFESKQIGQNVIAVPDDDFFRMNFGDDKCTEILAYAGQQEIRGEQNGNKVIFSVDRIKAYRGLYYETLDVSAAFCIELKGDRLVYTADIVNNTGKYILDFEYPRMGRIRTLGNGYPSLMWPDNVCSFYNNAGKMLSEQPRNSESDSNALRITYPGFATMGMTGLLDKKSALIVSIRDKDFISAVIRAQGHPDDEGCISLIIDKNLCIKNGRSRTAPIVAQLYKGDWKRGALDYAAWMNKYRPRHEKPAWVKNMLGYFLVINKQQFGFEMWDYDSLPALYDMAKEHGCDVLGLFGWYATGHDNYYPDLEVADTLGGEEKLKAGIRKIHDKGGKVNLYYQGHLIDTMSDYYRSGEGKRVACKTIWGTEYTEPYIKSHRSDFNAFYSRRVFSTACYACPEWRDLMADRMHWLASFGADGAIYDQVGGVPPYVCFDESHHHDGNNPARGITGGQRKLLARLHGETEKIGHEFTFMTEQITDVYSPYLDMVHGLYNGPGPSGKAKIGDETGFLVKPEVFRLCFPDAIITVRNARSSVSRRMANYSLTYGFPLELEIRYEQDKQDILTDRFKDLREYSKAVAALHAKYLDDIPYDAFTADRGITCRQPQMIAMGFTTGDTVAAVIWNDTDKARVPAVKVKDAELVSFEPVGGKKSGEFTELAAQTVAIAVFKKK